MTAKYNNPKTIGTVQVFSDRQSVSTGLKTVCYNTLQYLGSFFRLPLLTKEKRGILKQGT